MPPPHVSGMTAIICPFVATLDGGISLILPMMEKTYRRLLMLQNKLVECLQHIAGLNPKAFRYVAF